MTVVSPVANERDRALVQTIFAAVGRVRFLEEKHFDACTALSGSGPAFACIFLEAMADGGVMMGLPRAEALELAAQSTRAWCRRLRRVLTARCSVAGRGPDDASGRHSSGPAQGRGHESVVLTVCASLSLTHIRSSRRMHDRRPARARGRPCALDHRSRHPDRDGTGERTGSACQKVISSQSSRRLHTFRLSDVVHNARCIALLRTCTKRDVDLRTSSDLDREEAASDAQRTSVWLP
jgi:hypothetical protein